MYTYIIVDDESLIRKGAIKKLEPINEVITCIGEAENGAQAIDLIAKLNPDIIITDMNMPVLDGMEFLPLLTEKYPQKRIIVISGYKNFDYMKQAITSNAVDYILKPFDKATVQNAVLNAVSQIESTAAMTNMLASSQEKQEEASYDYDIQMLKNLIMGYHTESIQITSKRLNFINDTHNFLLITIHSNNELNEDTFKSFISENSFGDLALYLQHMNNRHLGFLVLFIPQKSVLTSKEICCQITSSLLNLYLNGDESILFSISDVHSSLSELNNAFIETVNTLNKRLLNNTETTFFYHSYSPESQSIIWDKTDEFLFRIEAGMTQQTDELINELFDYFLELNSITIYDVKVFCFNLSDQVRVVMSSYFEQVNSKSANSSMHNILNSMFTLKELKQYYIQFYTNIALTLKSNSIYAIDDTIEKVKLYVQKNYHNDLTIEFISSLFYMNRSYLSHLFKEKTGDTFVNYLNNVRLEKAKQLLLNTDKKMYQIAKSVGYDNVKYFFRVFKKYIHLTPEQFRNTNK